MQKILTEISPAELLDKISILEIKLKQITDKNSLEQVKKEYKILKETQNSSIELTGRIKELFDSIKEVNLVLWRIEDDVRFCEKNKDFGKNFIELARAIYFNNAKRSDIKSEINKTLGSNINEVKQYVNY
jgi:predicted  nucleic acid-binding Zn-ribbon protein